MVVFLFAVAAIDLLFAATLRLAGPLDSNTTWIGLGAMTLLGALASALVIRSCARGAFAFATAVPASVSAALCIALAFAYRGPWCTIRFAGLFTRATDMAWVSRLTLVGLACGAAFGIVLALMMRGRSWAYATAAFVGALAMPFFGLAGAALAAAGQLALGSVALGHVRAMRTATFQPGGPYRRLVLPANDARKHALAASAAMMAATVLAAITASRS